MILSIIARTADGGGADFSLCHGLAVTSLDFGSSDEQLASQPSANRLTMMRAYMADVVTLPRHRALGAR